MRGEVGTVRVLCVYGWMMPNRRIVMRIRASMGRRGCDDDDQKQL
jgi:hypothetical protein